MIGCVYAILVAGFMVGRIKLGMAEFLTLRELNRIVRSATFESTLIYNESEVARKHDTGKQYPQLIIPRMFPSPETQTIK